MKIFPMILFLSLASCASYKQTIVAIKGEERRVKFDPARDAAKDIEDAMRIAQKENKHILLDVGGEWCVWCHRLDIFLLDHQDLSEVLNQNYIEVKINFSPENENEKVLSRYPKIEGYPHLFVLDGKGNLLQSQDTGLLEEAKSYHHDKVLEFLKKWAPQTISNSQNKQ
jgi:thioredoxin-related protein